MSIGTMTQPKQNKLFNTMANPVIRRMEKHGEYAATNSASYGGITSKTLYFLLTTVIGVVLCFALHNVLLEKQIGSIHQFTDTTRGIYDITFTTIEGFIMAGILLVSIIIPFLCWFVRKAIPVVGTIYCLAQGMLIGYITVALAQQYKFASLLAMIITMSLVAIMLLMYAKHIITVTAKFKGVIMTMFFGIILSGIIYFLLNLIPAVRNSSLFSGINTALHNPVVSVVISIVFIIIASLFMLADFDTIQRCVENGIDKRFEWMAAWGLAYTILYIYFKVLNIILTLLGHNSRSSS